MGCPESGLQVTCAVKIEERQEYMRAPSGGCPIFPVDKLYNSNRHNSHRGKKPDDQHPRLCGGSQFVRAVLFVFSYIVWQFTVKAI